MKRRAFIAFMAGAVAARPLAGRAQQPAGHRIAIFHPAIPASLITETGGGSAWRAFFVELRRLGYIEGDNLIVERYSAEGHHERYADMAQEIVARSPDLIVTGTNPVVAVFKAATGTIPLVAFMLDPLQAGLVTSLARPGGNLTGITSINADISAKRFGVLRQMVPQATHYFGLVNSTSPLAGPVTRQFKAGAASIGVQIDILRASTDDEIDAAFAGLPRDGGSVLVSSPDAFLYSRRKRIAALAASHAVPAIFDVRDYVDAGALVSYGADYLNVMRLAGDYTARVLKGDKPAELPVVQPEKFELVINLRAAKALGVVVPPTLLAIADDVVE